MTKYSCEYICEKVEEKTHTQDTVEVGLANCYFISKLDMLQQLLKILSMRMHLNLYNLRWLRIGQTAGSTEFADSSKESMVK